MNYQKLLVSFFIGISFLVAQVASAQSLDSCFDYYKFQSVQVSVGSENESYNAGETVTFSGELINENTYPIIDGYVFVRVSEVNPNYVTEGHYAVDEFIALGPVSLDTLQSKNISFDWKIPTNLKSGGYRADYFFSVDKQFNLGGLPFTNEIIVGFDTFSVISGTEGSVYLDRAGTVLNDSKYQQIGNWPQVEEGSEVAISQLLKNSTNKDEIVEISYDLYFWDSLNEADLISSKTETYTVLAGKSKTLTYKIPSVDKSVYYLKMTAKTASGAQSILNVRVSAPLETARINYFAVTDFPLEKGDATKLFSCFHNTSDLATEGKVVLKATDIDGNEVASVEYVGEISSQVMAKVGELSALKDLTYLKLDQTLYDRTGALVYENSQVYDCSTLDSEKCREMSKVNYEIIVAIIAAIFLILSLVFLRKNKNLSIILLAVAIILAVLGAFLRYADTVDAEVVSNGGKTKSETRSRNYQWVKGALPSGRVAATGVVSLTHTITLNGQTNLKPGQQISFSKNTDCSFNLSGGAWDTPYCGSAIAFKDDTGRNGSLRLQHSGVGLSVTSSNNSILSCSGTVCTAGNKAGTVTVTATADQSTFTATNNSYTNVKLNNSGSESGSVCPDGTHNAVACGGSIINSGHKMMLYRANGDIPLVVASYSPTWSVTVAIDDNPPPPPPPPPPGGDGDGGGGGGGDEDPDVPEPVVCECGGVSPNCTLCKPDAKCGELATDSVSYFAGWTDWPNNNFCETGVVQGDTPIFLPEGGKVFWTCYSAGAKKQFKSCEAEIPGPIELEPTACGVEQDNSPALTESTIYSNRTAKFTSNVPSQYQTYTFSWSDITNPENLVSMGSGTSVNKIFTTIGSRKVKLYISKPGKVSAICYVNLNVIQKPTDIQEQ